MPALMTSRLQADQACKKISSAFIKVCLVFLQHWILMSYDQICVNNVIHYYMYQKRIPLLKRLSKRVHFPVLFVFFIVLHWLWVTATSQIKVLISLITNFRVKRFFLFVCLFLSSSFVTNSFFIITRSSFWALTLT